jgi:hypothetical protein
LRGAVVTTKVVLSNGGKIRHPLNIQDFPSFLLQAQASKERRPEIGVRYEPRGDRYYWRSPPSGFYSTW